jgi:Grx4 family monothiol glutaredoxin
VHGGCTHHHARTILQVHRAGAAVRPLRRDRLSLRMQEKGPMHDAIDKVVKDNKIILFMKGNKDFPQCGFSNTVTQILKSCKADFQTVNVLENELLRQGIKQYSNWPTIPQLYIDGEFIGGCDICIDMYQSGELKELIERVNNS